MSSGPSHDPVVQQLQLLLTAYGYNFYSATNQARSDDLLVRERASYFLGQALQLLETLRSDYHNRFIPPLTRENPFPPQEAMAQIRKIEEMQQTISRLEAHIRGMSVPTQDRIWWRFRQEPALLHQLLQFDLSLVKDCEQLHQFVTSITPENWQSAGEIQFFIQQVTQVVQDRERFLLLPR